jgi:cell wall-associated NlpC family hydrolase
LTCSPARIKLIETAMSLVGRVSYFWGGKSAAGWNEEWGQPRLVTATGSSSTGTLRPYSLDCSGYTDWVYKTALGKGLYGGSWNQWDTSEAITEAELLPGDLGFLEKPGVLPTNHLLIFAGYGADGKKLWLHCTSPGGVVFNTPSYQVKYFRRATGFDLDGETGG